MRFTYRRRHGWAGLVLLVVTLLVAYVQQNDGAKQAVIQNQPGLYSVAHFVDGDTIAVNMNGRVEKVRLVGVDTPETHKPNTPVQCYGPAAAAYTKNTIGSQKVRLVSDSKSTDRDRYDRLLRYIYLSDGHLLNEELIKGGYGFYYPYFPFSKSTEFAAAQSAARAAHRGLWGNCSPTPTDGGGWTSNAAT
jgi:micrococcal nuclease